MDKKAKDYVVELCKKHLDEHFDHDFDFTDAHLAAVVSLMLENKDAGNQFGKKVYAQMKK